jgi:DNA-binding NtrC family response regulator
LIAQPTFDEDFAPEAPIAHVPESDATSLDLSDSPTQPPPTLRAAKGRVIAQFEREYLSEVLHRCGGNVSRAAQTAGKERRTFQRLLRKYGLDGAAFRPCQG